jgi:signal transduction histidine kinase
MPAGMTASTHIRAHRAGVAEDPQTRVGSGQASRGTVFHRVVAAGASPAEAKWAGPAPLRYGVAAGLAFGAAGLNVVLQRALDGPTLLLPVTAAALSALYGGVAAGLFGAALAVACHAYFVLEPRYAFLLAHASEQYRVAIVFGVASLVAAVSGSLRSALWRAQEARARAEESAERLAFSHGLVTALASAHTQDDVTRAIFENGFEALGARTMLISRIVEPDQLSVIRAFGYPQGAAPAWERFPVSAALPHAEAVRTGKPIWIASLEEFGRRYPTILEMARAAGAEAWACVPIASEGEIIGSFSVGFARAHSFSAEERSVLESLATTCGQALERARLFEAERAARLRAETAEDEARRIGALQERLVAVVSHDLRNPLAAIISGIALLSKAGGLDDRQAKVHASIQKVASRMEGLIRDLLDFSRARRRFEMPTSSKPVAMDEVASRVLCEFRIAHPKADVRFAAEGEQRGIWDPARMEQALSNLVSNAVQHGDGSTVWVRSTGGPEKLLLEVENGGPRIPAEKLAVLFEPFQRGHGDRPGHLGLGLFIVREIVSAHGGTIGVASSPEGVTTFRMELPRGAEAHG